MLVVSGARRHEHSPRNIPAIAVKGPVTSIKIIPSEKIWTPEPEK
jgi:hypothetical protein